MRLFIAINFNDKIKNALSITQSKLKDYVSQGNFTKTEHLHLTIVFLGEVDYNRVDSIKWAMNQITAEPFTMLAGGLGRFMNENQERGKGDVWWVGVKRNQSLKQLYQEQINLLRPQGFNKEGRVYTPHITVARNVMLKEGVHWHQIAFAHELEIHVDQISLMKSIMVNGSIKYVEIFKKQLYSNR